MNYFKGILRYFFPDQIQHFINDLNKLEDDQQKIVRKKFNCPCTILADCDSCRTVIKILLDAFPDDKADIEEQINKISEENKKIIKIKFNCNILDYNSCKDVFEILWDVFYNMKK
tara:strand:+ start:204 stop:548 length:345 start_codon:yes stop_codon:yes gene_type:complete